MADRASVEAFIDGYRRTFETFDAGAVAACFAFPLHVTGEGSEVTLAAVPTLEAWRPAIERIVGAYRLLGVASAAVRSLDVVEVSPQIAQALVHWDLRTADDGPVYDFHASYTVADTADGLRITAVAHDEGPKLAAAVGRASTATKG
jgi:hypothetical protein